MQLRDLLKSEDLKKLNSVKRSEDKVKRKNVKKTKFKKDVQNKKVNDCLNEKEGLKKRREKVSYFENDVERKSRKLNYINECIYCGREDLIITASGFYVCEFCGIRVDKR